MKKIRDEPHDLDKIAPYLLHPGNTTVMKTLEATSQLGKMVTKLPLQSHTKSRNPLLNTPRLNESYATDTWFSGAQSYEGYSCCQLFAGINSSRVKLYGMRTESNGPSALLDFLRQVGAPISIRRDNSKMQVSHLWQEYMRRYNVADEFTEPYNPQQNPAEREIGQIKTIMERTFNDTGCDAKAWYRLACHVADVRNNTARERLEWRTPEEKATGHTTDITGLLLFKFWEDVYYYEPKLGKELFGKWCGRAENYGDDLSYWILKTDTEELIVRATVRKADKRPNKRFTILNADGSNPVIYETGNELTTNEMEIFEIGEDAEKETERKSHDPDPTIFSVLDYKDIMEDKTGKVPKNGTHKIDPNDLIDKKIIYDGKIGTIKDRVDDDNFRVQLENGRNRVLTYNELLQELLRPEEDGFERWEFEDILDHRWSPDKKGHIDLLIKWKGEYDDTWEPMNVIKKDDPTNVAEYAQKRDLLENNAWRWARRYVKNKKKHMRLKRMIMASKKNYAPKYQFGFRVPRTVKEAYALDKLAGNDKWAKAIEKEVNLLKDTHQCFKILPRGQKPPPEYQYIKLLWTFAVKFDGRHRARLVGGGHMTEDIEHDKCYNGVVSLEIIRLCFVIALLMELSVIAADIGSAYLQAYTKELVYTIAGIEFGILAGCVLIIVRALYGLRTSGNRWGVQLAENMRDMGFTRSKADDSLWMRDRGDHYEYVATYVDDLLVVSKEPNMILETIKQSYKYELKGVGMPEYYSGGNVDYDYENKTWVMSAKTYIKNICEKIEKLMDVKLKNYGSPMDPGDHPELDESDFLDTDQKQQYQMLIGCLQWSVTLGRFDVQYATNTMAKFSVQPRTGHLERTLRIFGYLKHHLKGRILFDVSEPNYDGLNFIDPDWSDYYPGACEDIPDDAPSPKVPPVKITTYCDASHGSDYVNRRGVTGVLMCVGKTPIKWYSKKQNTVETSTYGSELVAGRIATELIMELRYKLRMMGVHVDGPSILLIDNEGVVKNVSFPSSTLKKKHCAIAYHKMREAIASGIIKVAHVRTHMNRADGLTKPLGPQDHYRNMRMMIFGKNTVDNQGE